MKKGWVILIAVVVVVLLIVGAVINIYNNLVSLEESVNQAWAQVSNQYQRRADLIPNLVETVKGYAAHERETLQHVVEARNRAIASNGTPAEQARDENAFVGTLKSLFAVVENYPDLKASQNFLKLQQELANTEDRIQAARRFYNANVRDLNTRIEVIPSNLVASMFNFQKQEYFEIESPFERIAPKVQI